MAMASTSNVKGHAAKERGNVAFEKGQYAEAVGLYTEAILADQSSPIYVLNRSMAYMKLNKFQDAERDASTSIRLQADNPKAYFRRGSARKQLGLLHEAKDDFETVSRLDRANKDAKAEISTLQKLLVEKRKKDSAPKKEPLDLEGWKRQEGDSLDKERSKGVPKDSVEAARSFLERVGMEEKGKNEAQKSGIEAPKGTIPDRYPGETGGFLREISTRKLEKGAEERQPPATLAAASQNTSSTSDRSNILAGSVDEANEAAIASLDGPVSKQEKSNAVLEPNKGQLDLSPQAEENSKLKLHAYDFHRFWREACAPSDKAERVRSQAKFLHSLDISSLPHSLGSLLEPDLLASFLKASSEMLGSHASKESQRNLCAALLQVLPTCDRFQTSWMFLSATEKQALFEVLTIFSAYDKPLADRLAYRWGITL